MKNERHPERNWIKLNRALMEDGIWLDNTEPFDRRSAWVDLLMLAYAYDSIKYQNGQAVEVKRGQIPYSKAFFAKRWRWSIGKVSRYLEALEKDGKISKNSTTHGTTVTIVNYTFWQDGRSTDGTTGDTTGDTTGRTTDGKQIERRSETDKEYRYIDRENTEERGGHAPTLAQVVDLVEEEGLNMNAKTFLLYYESTGWKKTNGMPVQDWRTEARLWAEREKGIKSGADPKPNTRAAPPEPPRYPEFEPEPEREVVPMNDDQRRQMMEVIHGMKLKEE